MSIVRGPMTVTADRVYTCANCGRPIHPGDEVLLGRCNGHNIRVCCKKCFHLAVAAIERDHPVAVPVVAKGASNGEG